MSGISISGPFLSGRETLEESDKIILQHVLSDVELTALFNRVIGKGIEYACNSTSVTQTFCQTVGNVASETGKHLLGVAEKISPEPVKNFVQKAFSTVLKIPDIWQKKYGIPEKTTTHALESALFVIPLIGATKISKITKIDKVRSAVLKFLKDDCGAIKLPKKPSSSTSKQMIDIAKGVGYKEVSGGKGSHVKMEKPGAPMLIIPSSRDLPKGTIHSIWRTLAKAVAKSPLIALPLLSQRANGHSEITTLSQAQPLSAQSLPHDQPITPLNYPLEPVSLINSWIPDHFSVDTSACLQDPQASIMNISCNVDDTANIGMTVIPSNIRQSALTASTTLLSSGSGATEVGIVLNPMKPKQVRFSVMHAIGNTTLSTTLIPSKNAKKPNVQFSRSISKFGQVGGSINFRKPLHSTLSVQVPVMILGTPLSIGFDISLRKLKDSRIKLLLPLQPFNFLLKPLGINLPGIQLASVSFKKVGKVAEGVFRGIGRIFGFRRRKGRTSPEELAKIARGWEAYYKDIQEFHAKQQLVLRFPKDVERLGQLINELQPAIDALLNAQRTKEQLFISLEENNIAVNFSFSLTDEIVHELGSAVQELQQAAKERITLINNRPSSQESDLKLQTATQKLSEEVSKITIPEIQSSLKKPVEDLQKLQKEFSTNISNGQTLSTSVTTAAETNRTIQSNTEAIIANNKLLDSVAGSASQTFNVLQDNKNALVKKLKTKMTPEQARALQNNLMMIQK